MAVSVDEYTTVVKVSPRIIIFLKLEYRRPFHPSCNNGGPNVAEFIWSTNYNTKFCLSTIESFAQKLLISSLSPTPTYFFAMLPTTMSKETPR